MAEGRMVARSIVRSPDVMWAHHWQRWLWLILIVEADKSGTWRGSTLELSALIGGRRKPRSGQCRATLAAFAGRLMLSVKDLGGDIIEVQLTNWRKYQRLRDYGQTGKEGKGREEKRIHPSLDYGCAAESSVIESPAEACEAQARNGGVILRLCGYGFSSRRAREILAEHGHTEADMDDWERWARTKERPEALAAIQSHRNPNQIKKPRKESQCQQPRELTTEEILERQAEARASLSALQNSRNGKPNIPALKG